MNNLNLFLTSIIWAFCYWASTWSLLKVVYYVLQLN